MTERPHTVAAATHGDGLVHFVPQYHAVIDTACGISPFDWASRTAKADKVTCLACRRAMRAADERERRLGPE